MHYLLLHSPDSIPLGLVRLAGPLQHLGDGHLLGLIDSRQYVRVGPRRPAGLQSSVLDVRDVIVVLMVIEVVFFSLALRS